MTATAATYLPRLLEPILPGLLWRTADREQVLYLTFDDGPSARETPEILGVLAEYTIPATFFILGAHAERRPDLVRAVRSAGHTLGNHGYGHLDAWRKPSEALRADLQRNQDLLEDLAGRKIYYYRPPYGRYRPVLGRWARARGVRVVMWDVMPGDYLEGARPAALSDFVQRHVRTGSIVVLHDNPRRAPHTAEALRRLLPPLLDAGWSFAALPAEGLP